MQAFEIQENQLSRVTPCCHQSLKLMLYCFNEALNKQIYIISLKSCLQDVSCILSVFVALKAQKKLFCQSESDSELWGDVDCWLNKTSFFKTFLWPLVSVFSPH